MKAAALRLGGQGLSTTFDEHLLIIGDAAGHIDPLTGEGIHTAMMVSAAAACRSQARSSQGKPDAGHSRSRCGLSAVCWSSACSFSPTTGLGHVSCSAVHPEVYTAPWAEASLMLWCGH